MSYFTETFELAYQSLNEEGMRFGADRDSSTARKAMKWYSKFCTASKSKAENKQQIDERLKVLRASKKEMEDTLSNANGRHTSEQIMYGLKSMIPFNDIARIIDKQDAYAAIRIGADVIASFMGVLVPVGTIAKTMSFDSMLQKCIKDTDEAIEYLEMKRKEL